MEPVQKDHVKTYVDTYLYNKYPLYTKKLTNAIMQDPIIDKGSTAFEDVIYEVKRARVSDALVRILNSSNVILLNCDEPLPRAFKVFCAKDFRSKDQKLKIFIDCTNVITKSKNSTDLIVEESKLISYLINAGVTMVYHKATDKILSRNYLIVEAATCFAKLFTYIIDYLVKVSIQETNKIKVTYMSAMYFLQCVMGFDTDKSIGTAKKIAGISDREATMVDILLDKASHVKGVPESDTNPFKDIKCFIRAMREVMHYDSKAISEDIIVQKWMELFGPGTVFGLEYYPALSAMMTDAYVGSFLNSQKTIENICKVNMVSYSKYILDMINQVV